VRDGAGGPRVGFRPGYYVRFRAGGREVTRFAGNDRDTAVAYAQRLTREADRRDLLGETPRSNLRFEDFCDTYLSFAKQSMTEASFQSRRRLVNGVLLPAFKGRLLDEITPPDIQRFIATKSGGGATRNRSLTALSSIYRRAIDLGLLTKNPAREVRRAKEPRFPLTLVSDERVDALLARLPEPQRTFYLLLVESGLRLSEATRLEWPDVDFDLGAIHIRISKAKRPRTVAMTSALRKALFELFQGRTLPISGNQQVFPGAMGEDNNLRYLWRRPFKQAASAIGVPRLRVHDLRHLHAIALVRRNVDLPTVQAVLGHSSLLSTLRYAEYADDSAAFRAARALDASRSQGRTTPGGR
jgi:integrase